MAFKIDFNICQQDCETLLVSDQTGQYIDGVEECCKTGYGYNDNPVKGDVLATRFDFTYPDGTTIYEDVDCGYLPPLYACASFEITAADPGGSVAIVADGMMIGSGILVVDIAQLITNLVADINAGYKCKKHNYIAMYEGNVVTICDTCGWTYANGKVIDICVFNVTTDETQITLDGAGGSETWCFELTSGKIDQTEVDDCFDDGVYEVTMEVDIEDPQNPQSPIQYSETKKFLFTCRSYACLQDLILLAARGECKCDSKELHDRIQELRTNIEAAELAFAKCDYDCSNTMIQSTQKFCENVCLDCG